MIFLGSFALQVVMIAGQVYSLGWASSGRQRYKLEMLEKPSLFARRRLIAAGIWCVIFLVVSLVCAWVPTRTGLFMDKDFVSETRCIGPYSDEYRLDRRRINVTFVDGGDPLPFSRHPRDEVYLKVVEANKPRSIIIDVYRRGGWQPLVDLAPRAMQDFDDFRRSHAGY